MRSTILFFLTIGCTALPQEQVSPEYKISSEIYQTYNIPYDYDPRSVEMSVPPAPMNQFVEKWKEQVGEDFRPRDSYSIPVVSPSEMEKLLLKMKRSEIEDIAKNLYLQNSRFNVKCVGQKEMRGNEDYFLVLDSDDLTRIRLEILEVYRLRGEKGKTSMPLITLPSFL